MKGWLAQTCEYCAHWEPRERWEGAVCRKIVHGGNDGADERASLMSDWGAETELRTAPDFGCVLWKAK